MKKTYVNDIEVEEGDIIRFEMPPFCSGEYVTIVETDDNGNYIKKKDDFFEACRDYEIIKPDDRYYEDFKKEI